MHILLCLWGQHPRLITGKFAFYGIDPLFFATFATSLISAAKGIASFLLEGPCKLVPKKGLFGGMGTMGYIFLCLNITSMLLGKGLMLAFSYGGEIVRLTGRKVNTANVTNYHNSEHILQSSTFF